MILSKQQILERRLPTSTVDLGDGSQIIVRALPLHIVEQSQKIDSKEYGSDAFVFAHAVVDETGKRLYADEDIPLIAQTVNTAVLQLVVSESFKIARIDDSTIERIKKNWQSLGVSTPGG